MLTPQDWQSHYRITSVRGKIWSRRDLRTRVVRMLAAMTTGQSPLALRTAVQLVLDDPKFMQPRTGTVPSRVIEDAAFEALFRISGIARHQ